MINQYVCEVIWMMKGVYMSLEYNSIKWTISIGNNSGYELTNQQRISVEEMVERYQKVALHIEEIYGVYISAVIWPSNTIYKNEWGCPKGGEITYTLSGSCNPVFADLKKYREALLQLTKALRLEFKQSTLLLEMVPAEVYYDRED